nr:MAG TPA: hypothetical protein [Caudoviricetes sp.]DAV08024.1 MAG TPA: hypothetical protein [Caudoviricetes sp.]DAV76000.1 MAG TPA: hypothetical protein [Caudoviricetes sp.]
MSFIENLFVGGLNIMYSNILGETIYLAIF